MDVKNCPASSQTKLINVGGQSYQQILIYSLSVYYNLLNWVAIYSEKNYVFAPRGDMEPQKWGVS